ncbi:hypothetical protein GCM10028798_13680 [Humibacter antri]
MTESLPAGAVIRVSRVAFEPGIFDAVVAADRSTTEYLVPAIQRLPGLIHWYAGYSPDGSFVQISVWDTEEHAKQMDDLTEMNVRARDEFREVGVDFGAQYASIVNYPIAWTI